MNRRQLVTKVREKVMPILDDHLMRSFKAIADDCNETFTRISLTEDEYLNVAQYVNTGDEKYVQEAFNSLLGNVAEAVNPTLRKLRRQTIWILLTPIPDSMRTLGNMSMCLQSIITASKMFSSAAIQEAISEIKQDIAEADSLLREHGGSPLQTIEA